MTTSKNQYRPDYAVPPGWILEEYIEAQEISQAEFARRCGRSPKLISEIIAGKAALEPQTAIQFEKVLGMDAGIWLGIESDYRLHLARASERQKAEESVAWSKAFPVSELVKRGAISKPSSGVDRVSALLSFFGAGSVEAWQAKHEAARVAYRHSPSFKSDESALATWLRLGEMEAEKAECEDYGERAFKRALSRVRKLTASRSVESLDEAKRLCSESGVVLAVVKPLPDTALSGATRWLTPRKALIQLSARHMRDDQLWFSFFHEAAHILLHSKRDVFVHDTDGKITEADEEADRWAADFLVPPHHWEGFVTRRAFTKAAILRFAREQEIAPGVVVGRLQHEGLLPWGSALNGLKTRLKWKVRVD